MSDPKICSRDDCPPSNIKKDGTVNCGKCNTIIHLMCIGISKTASEVQISKNVIVVCNACVRYDNDSVSPAYFTPKSSKARTQRSILEFAHPCSTDDKSEDILTLLKEIKSSVMEHRNETKSYASVLSEIKGVSEQIASANKPLFSSVSASNIPFNADSNFPPLGTSTRKRRMDNPTLSSFTPKRSRVDKKAVSQKSSFVGRRLTSGTNANLNHGLGSPVIEQSGTRNPHRGFVDNFSKSLYVSKLKPSVTVESIATYLKESVPGITDDMFALRRLVKKDQNLDVLNFISFRLNCNDDLFNRLSDPSFWPAHVMIGEFIEKSKFKRDNLGDFLAKIPTPKSRQTSKTATSPSLETPTPMEETVDLSSSVN